MNPNSLTNLSMDGKIAVVTGSTQGLGEAIANLFVERGVAGLVITGRNKERGAKVKKDLEGKGTKVAFVEADLGLPAEGADFLGAEGVAAGVGRGGGGGFD